MERTLLYLRPDPCTDPEELPELIRKACQIKRDDFALAWILVDEATALSLFVEEWHDRGHQQVVSVIAELREKHGALDFELDAVTGADEAGSPDPEAFTVHVAPASTRRLRTRMRKNFHVPKDLAYFDTDMLHVYNESGSMSQGFFLTT